jgi:3',5'-cyclic-AMP phosphodiesterase
LGAGAFLRPVFGRAATTGAPLPQPGDSLRVVFLTDIHAREDLPGVSTFLDTLAERVNALQPDLILCGGDAIHGGFFLTEQQAAVRWDLFQRFREQLHAPLHAVAGNHDLVGVQPSNAADHATDPFALFRRQFQLDRNYGAFDQAGWHFVLLNSVEALPDHSNYRTRIDDEQMAWLRSHLAGVSPQTPIVLLTHIPLRQVISPFLQSHFASMSANMVVGNSDELLAAFADKNLRLILQGHLHVNAHAQVDGRDFVIGGAVCGEWWQGSNLGTPNGFGLLALSARDNGWQYFDCPWAPGAATPALVKESPALRS